MLKYLAKNWALRKPSPDNIPLSMPAAEKNDFYSVFIDMPSIGYNLLCNSESPNCLSGHLWINGTDGASASVLKNTLKNHAWSFKAVHYYRDYAHEYNSPASFLFFSLLQWHRFTKNKELLAQALFNNKKLVRAERVVLLEYIFKQTCEKDSYKINVTFAGSELHSSRWFKHPEKKGLANYYKLLLESLVQSEDLVKDGISYKLNPKALITLSEYAKEEQKHNDNQNSAKKTRSLTYAIIVLGTLNLIFQLVKWIHDVS